MALLEQPHTDDAQANTFVMPITFDALLPCCNESGISPVTCSSQYMLHISEHVHEGIYQLLLKVNILFRSLMTSSLTVFFQRSLPRNRMFICSAQANMTTNSLFLVKLLLCNVLSQLYTSLTTFSQLCRLHLSNNFKLSETYTPSIVDVAGFVFTLNAANNMFSVSLTQNIATDTPTGTLTVHVIFASHPIILPTLNDAVTFTGELLTVQHAHPILNLIHFHPVVPALP